MAINNAKTPLEPKNKDLTDIRKEFSVLYTDELPDDLPSQQNFNHKIEVDSQSTAPSRDILLLSTSQPLSTKE